MCQVITAPEYVVPKYKPSVFLAGGITNCRGWQKDVISFLKDYDVTLFNPRRDSFDITDKNASYKQVGWEFYNLERADVFSMYFCSGDSDQPICMYELGRNILRMQNRFPADWEKRIIISVEDGYKRTADVLIQTELATDGKVSVKLDANPITHASHIVSKLLVYSLVHKGVKCEDLMGKIMTRFSTFSDDELNAMEPAFYNEGLEYLIEEIRRERRYRYREM